MKKFGVQLYTIREQMTDAAAIAASFAKIKALGYDEVQTAGCRIPYDEFGHLAQAHGLTVVGTHDSWDQMLTDLDTVMANHRALGTTNIGIGGMPGAYRDSREGLETFIRLANDIAAKISRHGFKFTYHNHSFEFAKMGQKTLMEQLVSGLDPQATSFVLDTYWVQRGGGDVRWWIEKLKGRIDILHLKDMAIVDNEPRFAEIGQGNMNMPGIIATAEQCGVRYFVVEQDTCPGDPFDSLRVSGDYLRQFVT
ncbi:MAG: sugar phosphate isomerase/epimerase [Eubacteriales bacterium]|nr:sugar phosphate isomerase/epimerase [Eubacteriales bacterium]